MRLLSIAALLLIAATGFAQDVVREDDDWSINSQGGAGDWEALIAGENLALGTAATLQPEPVYAPTVDPDDAAQLTDGVLSAREDNRIWFDRGVVGWANVQHVRLTLDLGQTQPVGQVVMRLQTCIGADDTTPRDIQIALSNDGRYFSPARSLTKRTHPEDSPALTFEPLPPADGGQVHAFVLALGYAARYVRLDFVTDKFLVADEIAVLAAEGEVKELPAAPETEPEFRDNIFDRHAQYEEMTAAGNLIEGAELAYVPKPNYRLTTDEDDPWNLTDGQFGQRTDERIWFEKPAVGWQHSSLVTIFADMGEDQPVGSVVIRCLGGGEQGSLFFPDEIRVLLSDDGEQYYRVSERHKRGLDDLSPTAWDLPEEKLAWVHNFQLPVKMRARYVAVQLLHQQQFICADELAVVRGADDLPDFKPDPASRITIVSEGVAFEPLHVVHPICHNRPVRTKLSIMDARPGDENKGPCQLLIDLPDSVQFDGGADEMLTVQHDGRDFTRYVVASNRGKYGDFYLQTTLPAGETDTLYLYGDSGAGPQNERKVTWESMDIPEARPCERLRVSLAWMGASHWYTAWPEGIRHLSEMGFNAVGTFPRYWKPDDVPVKQEALAAARAAGMKIVVNESPAGAMSRDRAQEETKSQLPDGPGTHVCPSYRGQYYEAEHASFGDHAVWAQPDYIFYDIEAYWHGAQEAPKCERCMARFEEGNYADWDEFRGAMGLEIHQDMKAAIEGALADAGIDCPIIYGGYRTQPINKLNDGIFAWETLYPELLQMAMPSLYVAGDQMRVARSISSNRELMPANDIVPWLSPGTYGEYEPVRSRDMILESLANGSNGITYYYYGNFDPLHFKYHAEAIDIVAPIEDIFMDGMPIEGMSSDAEGVKLCGMVAGGEMAILVSNYQGAALGTNVRITAPLAAASELWDLHSGEKLGDLKPGDAIEVTLDDIAAHMYYVGNKYGADVPR